MTKKLPFALAIVLLLNLPTMAQTFEIDLIKQVPSITANNMKIIAVSVQKLFEEAIKNPDKNSSLKAVSDTVYGFYDIDGDRKLDKVNPRNGKQYTASDNEGLKKNSSLLFNLTFEDSGNLIVPEKIYVISNRDEDQEDRTIKTVGLLAFELTMTESIKSELSKVKLQDLAKTDVNSLTGGLNPVAIKIPFDLSFNASEAHETKGKAVKNIDLIDITINRYFKGWEEKEKFIKMLKEQTDILEYKKGDFEFVIEENSFDYHIDINIQRDIVWSSQPTRFLVKTEKLKSFSGDGKKIKK